MKIIYCDTNTLLHNVRPTDGKCQFELTAVKKLLAGRQTGKYLMYRSLVALREVDHPRNAWRRALLADYQALEPILNDEKVLRFHTQSDRYGGCITYPLVSDVQDDKLCDELIGRGLTRRDAQHITQAVCNRCDVFLTRDETIIERHGRWIETRFPPLKVRRPSALLEELNSERIL